MQVLAWFMSTEQTIKDKYRFAAELNIADRYE